MYLQRKTEPTWLVHSLTGLFTVLFTCSRRCKRINTDRQTKKQTPVWSVKSALFCSYWRQIKYHRFSANHCRHTFLNRQTSSKPSITAIPVCAFFHIGGFSGRKKLRFLSQWFNLNQSSDCTALFFIFSGPSLCPGLRKSSMRYKVRRLSNFSITKKSLDNHKLQKIIKTYI